jgi:iron-sulfur cluster repair protein YtfE (RIC family)
MIPIQQLFSASGADVAGLDAPLDHLLACHRRVEVQMSRLARATAPPEAPLAELLSAVRDTLAFAGSSLRLHREDEERSLFPRLRSARATPGDLAYLAGLEAEHAAADELWSRLRAVVAKLESGAAPRSEERATLARLARELEAHYGAHIASEDDTMMELSRRLLSADELRLVAVEMKLRRGQPA